MAKGEITCLFDDGQVCQETWNLSDVHRDSLPARLERIAHARLPLLGSSVRIVRLKVPGHPLKRVSLRGTGGGSAHPRLALKLIDGGRTTGISLRGVPKEVFGISGLTPTGTVSFRAFSQIVNECGCMIVRQGEARPITKLEPFREMLLSHEKGRAATLRKLVSILGAEEAQRFWAGLKQRQAERKARVVTQP